MKVPSALLTAWLVAGPAWPQAAEEPPRVAGSEVPAPKRVKFVSPQYPADAQARGLRGIVILELMIDTGGKVASATVTRSVPPFDDAALAAVRQWEYEVTRVGGKPVPVRLSVPITFTMPVPRASRQEGIPEIVQGRTPAFPAGQDRAEAVVAELTVESTGQVMEIEIQSGETAFADALMDALRTWRFAPESSGAAMTFRVEADFVPASKGGSPRVDLRLAAGLSEASRSPAPDGGGAHAAPSPSRRPPWRHGVAASLRPSSAAPVAPPRRRPLRPRYGRLRSSSRCSSVPTRRPRRPPRHRRPRYRSPRSGRHLAAGVPTD